MAETDLPLFARSHLDLACGHGRREQVAEEIRAVELARSSEQHVVRFPEIRHHHPGLAKGAEE
jgi:hypothetical protein